MNSAPKLYGNPYNSAFNQHIHTPYVLSNFFNSNGQLEVKFVGSGKTVTQSKIVHFSCCSKNQYSDEENDYMTKIENEFHAEIDNMKPFFLRNHEAITRYSIYWRTKHYYSSSLTSDKTPPEIGNNSPSMAQERNIPIHQVKFSVELDIERNIEEQLMDVKNLKWGLLEAMSGEFLVADSHKNLNFIPISPTLAFAAGVNDMLIDEHSVANINARSINASTDLFFAKSIGDFPVA